MRPAFLTGLSFGLTSGVITTLGLMTGLHSGTHSKAVVLGGILTIALADSLSDALGIHISEESKNSEPPRAIWEATLATLFSKFVIAGSFGVPVIFMKLDEAVMVAMGWGFALLTGLSFFVARAQGIRPWPVIAEHVTIAMGVVVMTHYLGAWIQHHFNEAG